jgi:hypothetical protein
MTMCHVKPGQTVVQRVGFKGSVVLSSILPGVHKFYMRMPSN